MPKTTYHIEALDKDNYDTWTIQAEAVLVKNKLWKYVDKPLPSEPSAEQLDGDREAKSELILFIVPSQLKDFKNVLEWAQCGSSAVSAAPTLLWALGAAALARHLLEALFRRFLFRRVPWWELLLQHLLFVWIVIYSVNFWVVLVRVIKALVDFLVPSSQRQYLVQQCAVWAVSIAPLGLLLRLQRAPRPQPLMIWMTTSPWQRREMGPYGYYLQRPPAPAPPPPPPAPPRRARSDPMLFHHPTNKKRCSKSI